jgi:hypothetical protein
MTSHAELIAACLRFVRRSIEDLRAVTRLFLRRGVVIRLLGKRQAAILVPSVVVSLRIAA